MIDISLDGGILDLNGWEVGKALKMIRESNCSVIEWLYSPMVYYDAFSFLDVARALSRSAASRKSFCFNYLNKARKHMREYFIGERWTDEVILKKYFYVLRPLLCLDWLRCNEEGLFVCCFDV